MNDCLCCGKPLHNKPDEQAGWHGACIKKLFGTSVLPDIDVSEEVLHQLALESIGKGYTVPGVQQKLSLHLTADAHPRLTLVNYPTGFILKPQTDEHRALPEMEYLVMRMAAFSGIKTVPFALIKLSSQNNAYAYITKRIDRDGGKMLAMEDFCQLDGRLTEDKYRGSYERCGKIVSKYSVTKGLDLSEFFLRLVFSFAVGNSDMHLKNFSLIETGEGTGEYRLSAAYDMLSVNVVLPDDMDQMALTMNGKKRNICRKDFLKLAESIEIPQKSAENMIKKIASLKDKYIEMCEDSYLSPETKEVFRALIGERIEVFSGNDVAN